MADVNGGVDRDALFAQRDLVQPWYKLLTARKMLFALAPFTELFALPEEKRQDFDFRWLSRTAWSPSWKMSCLPASCARRETRRKRGRSCSGSAALPTQQSLLTVNQSRRIGVFGVTNGFSALKSINEKDLPQKYPILLGHVPLESFLSFPEMLPDNWLSIRGTNGTDGVIWQWILAAASVSPSDQPVKPLDKTLQEWSNRRKNDHRRRDVDRFPCFPFDITIDSAL